MFVAFSKVFTPENLLYFAKGAVVSLLLAAVSLLFGIVFGIGIFPIDLNIKILELLEMCMLKSFMGHFNITSNLDLFSVIPSIYTAFYGNVLRINVFNWSNRYVN